MALKKINWKLCFIADSEALAGKDTLSLIQEAVKGGVTFIQLRGKKWKTCEFLEIGLKTSEFLNKKNIPLIINDRVDIALACDACGVHLGQEDLPLPCARKVLGKKKVIGISANNIEEALQAERGSADYLGVGPIFPTPSKQDLKPFLGLEGLRRIKEKTKIPVVAIGGINLNNAREVIEAGADGVAVISVLSGAKDIRQAAVELKALILKAKKN